MEKNQVMLRNTINSRVVINIPELHFKRVWEKRGVKKSVPVEVLREAFYYPSVEYLLRQGILFFDDMKLKIELGLEEADAETPALVELSDNDYQRYLGTMPTFEFREKLKTLTREQIQSLVDYAIEKELTPFDKCEILKQYTQTDIIKAVQLNKSNKEG